MIGRDKAHKVFVEAIRCNYDNWKVWENFLWVCLIELEKIEIRIKIGFFFKRLVLIVEKLKMLFKLIIV